MKRYETIVIVDPDVSEDERNAFCDKILDIISQLNGALIEREDWGVKKLAYEIRKKLRGYYIRLDYCGSGAVVDEIERFSRISDCCLKYMTILLADKADPEKIKEEIAAARIQPATPAEETSTEESEMSDDEDADATAENEEEE
jgi:small subunit ribosomal protein S6